MIPKVLTYRYPPPLRTLFPLQYRDRSSIESTFDVPGNRDKRGSSRATESKLVSATSLAIQTRTLIELLSNFGSINFIRVSVTESFSFRTPLHAFDYCPHVHSMYILDLSPKPDDINRCSNSWNVLSSS